MSNQEEPEPASDEARERTQGLHKWDPGGNCIMMRLKLLGT